MIPALALSFCVGCILGRVSFRVQGFARNVYYHTTLGICWRYRPSGYRQLRDGTVSDFCLRCGHSAGYHTAE